MKRGVAVPNPIDRIVEKSCVCLCVCVCPNMLEVSVHLVGGVAFWECKGKWRRNEPSPIDRVVERSCVCACVCVFARICWRSQCIGWGVLRCGNERERRTEEPNVHVCALVGERWNISCACACVRFCSIIESKIFSSEMNYVPRLLRVCGNARLWNRLIWLFYWVNCLYLRN